MKIGGDGAFGSQYTQIPSAETLQNDVGFTPKTPVTLGGDFKFSQDSVTETYDVDSQGAAVNVRKGIHFYYKSIRNGVTKKVSLSAEPKVNQTFSENSTVTAYGEHSLYYSTRQANSVAWFDDNIYYSMMDMDRIVTSDELIAMAKEMIDMKADTTGAH